MFEKKRIKERDEVFGGRVNEHLYIHQYLIHSFSKIWMQLKDLKLQLLVGTN